MAVKITLREQGARRVLSCGEGQSILDVLQENGIYASAACGGRGRCGKCRIGLLKGTLPVTSGDQKLLSEEELGQGVRLACLAYPREDCEICLLVQRDEDFDVLAEAAAAGELSREREYGIAVDIGTTTLAMALVGLESGKIHQSYSAVNHQRAYGADVISRIQASNEGKGPELTASIRRDLKEGITWLIRMEGISPQAVKSVTVAGNTTMGHLLMGYSCENLGVYPFRPVNIDTITIGFGELLGAEEGCPDCPVTLLPGISTYVGGDILSGLMACGFDEGEDICVLVDLGTNGEMAAGNRDRILVTSTAAGPAFEGGNISWGMGSVAGAISNVTIQEGKAQVKTIGDKLPRGLCGTGVIETAAELVRSGCVDETGKLDEAYFQEGFPLAKTPEGKSIVFTQKDVREIQLAKSAVRAGLETLLKRLDVSADQIRRVYLAGGFGFHMNQEKAVEIGLLPKRFADRLVTVGNSSLSGAVQYLCDALAPEKAARIRGAASEVELSSDSDFNAFYMDYMYFEEDSE